MTSDRSWDGILAAAGRGERLGLNCPKALAPLAGIPLFLHSLRVLWNHPGRERLVLVAPPEAQSGGTLIEEILREFGGAIPPGLLVVKGGEHRQESVLAGLNALEEEKGSSNPAVAERIVLIHDAARPLVTPALIDRCFHALSERLPNPQDELPGLSSRHRARGAAGVVPGLPVQETLKLVFEGRIVLTQPRENLYAVQTPQVFRLGPLLDAHHRARHYQLLATDDAALLERQGSTVLLVPGDAVNLKVTVPEDLAMAERLLRKDLLAEPLLPKLRTVAGDPP